MVRQGKYTKRVTPVQHAKRRSRRSFRWLRDMSWKKRIAYIGGPILAFLILTPIFTYIYFARDIADQERLMNRNNTGVVLLASDGKTELYSLGRAKHRELVGLDKISDNTEKALLSSEDKDFYNHGGFSVVSMVGALYANVITGGKNYGGSTLTQQLAKITLLSDQKSYLRKFQELSVSIAMEQTYSKDEILAMYLNSVFFGGNVFGIEEAAKTYFNKSPADLTLGESAMLIGILPSPNTYSPLYGDMKYALERQNTVLTRMVDNGVITEAEKKAALAEKLPLQPATSLADSSKAPHFTEMVMNELYEKYGEEKVARSGYQVTTTLDANMQSQLQAAVTGNMATINRNSGTNASAVAIDPTTGEVRALVGSYNWDDEKFGKVNMVTTPRQPGSSFKPLYYAQALADGKITPATMIEDKKTDFGGWTPQNADRRFRGDVSVRNALNWSLNIPAVKVMQQVGVQNALATAKRMGITTLDDKKDYGLPLALGAGEVPLLEMTNAYAALANDGEQHQTTLVRDIQSKFGDKVFKSKPTTKRVISEQGAYLISDILSDNDSRRAVFYNTLTVTDAKTRQVKKAAVKTGTTDESRDAWTIGYTPQLAIGVWVGNNDNTPMANGGSIMAGPIWTKAMGAILAGTPTEFPMVPGIVTRQVCANGALADAEVKGKTHAEVFLASNLPTTNCNAKPVETKPEVVKPEEDDTTEITATIINLSVSPEGGAEPGRRVTLTAEVSPDVQGTVTFYDGGTPIGSSEVIGASKVTLRMDELAEGSHLLSAKFTPADSTKAAPASSSTVTYVVAPRNGSGTGAGSGTTGPSVGNGSILNR